MRSAAAVLLLCVGTAAAFAPRPTVMLKTTTLKAPLTQVAAILPEHVDAMSAAVSQFQHFSFIMLSDAAVADATDAVQESGWWSNYLGLFKSFLSFIHATIDQPLRDQGITQTWGISIAIFTAGTTKVGCNSVAVRDIPCRLHTDSFYCNSSNFTLSVSIFKSRQVRVDSHFCSTNQVG